MNLYFVQVYYPHFTTVGRVTCGTCYLIVYNCSMTLLQSTVSFFKVQ